ncbi:guanylate-binding protein [Fimicolochytrium jonesii]|uniref:guanylate-binding protein n=1 Tax=Fimicolochytrium jonesii TaxID=1396493 RepID=UPI0022FDF57A|nr:guanylate-binding protein [Fimicolochytrium jonesii]KAI8816069.1 guanylate-binding protein [Fimicolochytrium jonesii]
MGCGASKQEPRIRQDGVDNPEPAPKKASISNGPHMSEVTHAQSRDDKDPAVRQLSKLGSAEALGCPPGLDATPANLVALHHSPIQFIHRDHNESKERPTFTISPEGKTLLEGIQDKVAVIGIVGTFGHGKSFLMNQLVGIQDGFALGSKSHGETRGVWIWALKRTDRGETVLLLDFEGLADTENPDPAYDMQLFTLGMLLSSCLIYNCIAGAIDANQLNSLSCITQIAKHLHPKSQPETSSGFDIYFPSLVWVLRDANLDHESVDGKEQTDDEYLEEKLKEEAALDDKSETANEVRRAIKETFKSRHLRRMPRPVHSNHQLKYIEKADPFKIKTIWYEKMDELRRLVLSVSPPKEIYSPALQKVEQVSGPAFLARAQTYIDIFNRGDMPTFSDT